MASITQQQLQDIFKKADASGKKMDRAQIVQELVNRGNTIEGLNDPPKQKSHGLFDQLMKRAADTQAAVMSHPDQSFRNGLNILGGVAGGVNDIIGAGLGVAGNIASAVTPDFIENPIKNVVGGVASAVGQSAPVQGAMQMYGNFKENNPALATDIESAANIASFIPIGKLGQVGQQAAKKGLQKTGVEAAQQGTSRVLKESAEASVSKVLNPTTNATKATTQKLAPELVQRPLSDTLALTRKGMVEKAGTAAEVAGQAIDNAGPLSGSTKTKELVDFLQSQKQQFTAGGKIISKEGVQSVDEVTDLLAQYGKEIPDETLRDIRRIFDAEFYQGKKNIAKSTAETSQLTFKKQAADKIRGILAQAHPEVAALNKEFAFWSGLEDVLEKTTARRTGQKGAVKALAAVGGAVAGQGIAGKVAGSIAFRTVASLVDSPAWGFMSAKVKNGLADAIANSDLSKLGKVLSLIPGQTAVQSLPSD